MGMFENGIIFKSAGIGLGVVLLAPVIARVAGEIARPLVKTVVKSGIVLYDRGRTIAAETMESLDDITAEAKSEMQKEHEESAQASAALAGQGRGRSSRKRAESVAQGEQRSESA